MPHTPRELDSDLAHPADLRLGWPLNGAGRDGSTLRLSDRFSGNHYGNVGQPFTQLFHPSLARGIRQTRIESQNFHLAAVLRVVIRRQFGSVVLQRPAADAPQYRGRPVALGRGADAHAASQKLRQAVGSHGDAQRFGGAAFFGHDRPSPHLGECRAALLRARDLRLHRCPQTQTPLRRSAPARIRALPDRQSRRCLSDDGSARTPVLLRYHPPPAGASCRSPQPARACRPRVSCEGCSAPSSR